VECHNNGALPGKSSRGGRNGGGSFGLRRWQQWASQWINTLPSRTAAVEVPVKVRIKTSLHYRKGRFPAST